MYLKRQNRTVSLFMTDTYHKNGFTLVELLVVISIMGVLMGILLPTLSKAREAARSTQCQANLHSIGQAVRAYINDNHGYYPPMALIPTVEEAMHGEDGRGGMNEVLGPYVEGEMEIFHCPCDRFINPGESVNPEDFAGWSVEGISDPMSPGQGVETWFEWQGSSYQPVPALSLVDSATGKWQVTRENSACDEVLADLFGEYLAQIPIMYDYESFHPKADNGYFAGKMLLYADFHVDKGNNNKLD